ncbi:MAG: hypothetical protein HY350_04815 [Candidatus Omnitrophica bacterium]|nr:hypothetical protein [Candidatus Omnitrophota bacterium]
MEDKELIEGFKNPGPEYRSAPFWSWNERIEPKEVCRQLGLMKTGGYGGGFMHSRIGLVTSYMGREWMTAIKAGVDYAGKNGILAYLYDEDRWPSGFAGGLATKKKKNQMQVLTASKDKKGKWVFHVETSSATVWFNNLPYLNTLKKDAVEDFIKSTYEVYRRETGDNFGKTVPAIFTDEPNYSCSWGAKERRGVSLVPYTDELPALFQKEYGYPIEPNYPSIFARVGNWQKVRCHYWRLLGKLFQINFGKQIYDWCEKYNIALTGHYLAEDNLISQISVIGAVMPLYEYMQIPGVDHLANNINNLLTLKQCSSVANQLGRKRVLSELFGCAGQNMTFLDRKWIGDWHFALGINLFCPHLWLYSMAGCRKRDYPPTLSYQQPWWQDNKPLEDYFGRVSYLFSQGKFAADILVLHPVESGFVSFEPGYGFASEEQKEISSLNDSFVSLLEELLANHFEFDLGDETIIEKYGNVSGEKLSVKEMAYRVIVLPETITIRRSTLGLIMKFIQSGGKVVVWKTMPQFVDGEKDENALKELAGKVKICDNLSGFLFELESCLSERIHIRDGKIEAREVYLHRRAISEKEEVIFLANTSKKEKKDVDLLLSKKGLLEELDVFRGDASPARVENDGVGIKKSLRIPPGGSRLFLLRHGQNPVLVEKIEQEDILVAECFTRDWKAKPLSLNSFTLDFCDFRIGKGKWKGPEPVLKVQEELEKTGKNVSVALRFYFDTNIAKTPSELFLVLEHPEQFKITVNGCRVRGDEGFWIDTSFRKIDILKSVKPAGKNIVELETVFTPPRKPNTLIYRKGGTELESIYLLGDFGISGQFVRIADGLWARNFKVVSQTEATPENLTANGYPFFAGRFRYSGKIRLSIPQGGRKGRYFLQLEEPSAITHKVKVNGKEAGLIFLPPYRIEVSGLLSHGDNEIEIEAATSLRNLLGPHHNKFGESAGGVGPGSFLDKTNWADDYHVVPAGLKGIRIYASSMDI